MNDWTPNFRENLLASPELENEIEKTVELAPFIIVCMLEIFSVKYEEYQCYH